MNKSYTKPAASATQTAGDVRAYDVVILGAGYAGLIAALRLWRQKLGLCVALVKPPRDFARIDSLPTRLQVRGLCHKGTIDQAGADSAMKWRRVPPRCSLRTRF